MILYLDILVQYQLATDEQTEGHCIHHTSTALHSKNLRFRQKLSVIGCSSVNCSQDAQYVTYSNTAIRCQ